MILRAEVVQLGSWVYETKVIVMNHVYTIQAMIDV